VSIAENKNIVIAVTVSAILLREIHGLNSFLPL
jgi:hypothetical protein